MTYLGIALVVNHLDFIASLGPDVNAHGLATAFSTAWDVRFHSS
jgi:hypothetical protein